MFVCLLFAITAFARPFTNADLHRLGDSLVYSWSPHMNLSVRGLDEALERERHGGPRVVALLDPGANRALAKKIAKEHGWPDTALRTEAASELAEMGIRVH